MEKSEMMVFGAIGKNPGWAGDRIVRQGGRQESDRRASPGVSPSPDHAHDSGKFARGCVFMGWTLVRGGSTEKPPLPFPAEISGVVFCLGRLAVAETPSLTMRKACPKLHRPAHGSAATDREWSPCSIRRGARV